MRRRRRKKKRKRRRRSKKEKEKMIRRRSGIRVRFGSKLMRDHDWPSSYRPKTKPASLSIDTERTVS